MVNALNFQTHYSILFGLNFAFNALFHKLFGRMANREDLDQTASEGAVLSGSTLFA